MQTADILTWMQQDILLKADKMSMAASLELRVPFLDREVFAVARTLPASRRVTRRETKPALRRAAARALPAATAARPKIGFTTPLAQWLREEPWGYPGARGAERRCGPHVLPHRPLGRPHGRAPARRTLEHEEDLVGLLLPHLARAVFRVERIRIPRVSAREGCSSYFPDFKLSRARSRVASEKPSE